MNIRHPWGKFEWDGAWADDSEEWTEEMIEIFKPVFDTNDGGFWMSFDDFIQKFVSVNACLVKPWQEARMKGKFIRLTEKSNKAVCSEDPDWIISKFYYTFTVSEACNLYIGLH